MIFSPYTRLHISRISFYFYSLNFIFICGLAAHTFNEKMVHEKSVITNSIGILLRLMTRSMLCDFCLFSFHTSVHLYLLLLVFPFFCIHRNQCDEWVLSQANRYKKQTEWRIFPNISLIGQFFPQILWCRNACVFSPKLISKRRCYSTLLRIIMRS